jgi:hypothetical protein
MHHIRHDFLGVLEAPSAHIEPLCLGAVVIDYFFGVERRVPCLEKDVPQDYVLEGTVESALFGAYVLTHFGADAVLEWGCCPYDGHCRTRASRCWESDTRVGRDAISTDRLFFRFYCDSPTSSNRRALTNPKGKRFYILISQSLQIFPMSYYLSKLRPLHI